MTRRKISVAGCSVAITLMLAACGSDSKKDDVVAEAPPKNVIFFLGDGLGLTTMTAARIYSVGEDGSLTMDTLPETAFVKTFSNDAQVTDSAPSMAAYMTGVKMNNEVISMAQHTIAKEEDDVFRRGFHHHIVFFAVAAAGSQHQGDSDAAASDGNFSACHVVHPARFERAGKITIQCDTLMTLCHVW